MSSRTVASIPFAQSKRLSLRQAIGAVAVLVAVLEVLLDWTTWIQLNVSIVYVLPLVVAAMSRSRRLLWILTGTLACMTFVVYARQTPLGGLLISDPYLINRILAVFSLFVSAGLLHALIGAFGALDAKGEEAEQTSRRKTRLLASVSHDLRTPLTTVNMIADVIHRMAAEAGRDGLRTIAADLQKSARTLSELVANALDIALFDSGHSVLHETEFSLDALLADECHGLEALALAKELFLRHELTPQDIWIRADRVKLARIVRNLVGNAIKFTPKGGIVVDASVQTDKTVDIRVADTGAGIASKDLDRIFDEFERLGAHEGMSGFGLGLPICKRLITLMGGAICVEPNSGGGSVFILTLPASCWIQNRAMGSS